MYLVGSYLFSGDDLAEHLSARSAEAVQAAAAITSDDITAKGRDAVLRDLHARFVIPVTQMHVDRAAFENERPLSDDERDDYARRARTRVLAGQRRLASAIAGGTPMYEKPADRRFDHDIPEKMQEAAMLLDSSSRLGQDGIYIS